MTASIQPKRNWLKLGLSWFVFVVFLIGVEYWVGWRTVLTPWLAFSWEQGLIAFLLLVVSYALRTWRMYDYFPEQLAGHWFGTWRIMLIHNALNNLLPARTGEASFPMLMKRYFDISYAYSISALMWFRILDLHAILSFALYPLLLLTPLRRIAIPLVVLWLSAPIGLFLLQNKLEQWLAGNDSKIGTLMQQAMYGLPNNWAQFWRSWVMTWANWGVKLVTMAWLLAQFVPQASWNLLITSVVGGELTSVLPIHAPAGIGTYETGIIVPLSRIVEIKLATTAAINVHLFVLGSSLFGGLLGWMIPFKPKN